MTFTVYYGVRNFGLYYRLSIDPRAGVVHSKAAEPTVPLAVGVAAQAPVPAVVVNVCTLRISARAIGGPGVAHQGLPALYSHEGPLRSQVQPAADSEQEQQGQQTGGPHFDSCVLLMFSKD